MRTLCLLALALVSLAPPGAAEEHPLAIERAFASRDVVVVADRGGNRSGRGRAAWDESKQWARRAPRAIERATREALREIDDAISPPPAPRRRTATPASQPAPAPASEPTPEPPAPIGASRAPEPQLAATVAPPAAAAPRAKSRAPLWGGLALAASALVAALALARRRSTTPGEVGLAPSPLALAAGADPGRTTKRRTAHAVVTAPAEAIPFPGGGRYEILEEIGRGGMGVVYKARDKRLDRVVALKRLPDSLESESRWVELLLREARSAARLNHRNIVTVHDVDRENGSWFITMELLEGRSVESLLRERGRIAPRSVVWIADQAVAGLGYAHERGIVHRDVKPANLFVTRERTVKLMDFGVAKILEEARRKRTLIGGTPAYMAPEQAIGERVDGRADLYALGATLFELLTGDVPFASGDAIYHHRSTEPPDPRTRVAAIPAALAELVLALMRKQPEARPASAADVAARLRAIAAKLPPLRDAAARSLLAFALALASLGAPPAHAGSAPSGTTAVAANESEEASGWRRAPAWMKRNLDPRRLGRATRDALRSDEAAETAADARAPARRGPAAPKPITARSPSQPAQPKALPQPKAAAPQPAKPAKRAPTRRAANHPAPTPPAPPTPAEVMPAAPALASEQSNGLRDVGLATALALLATALVWRRRRAPEPAPTRPAAATPALLALPAAAPAAATAAAETTVVEDPAATIDVAVVTAIEQAEATPQPFPGGGRYEILEELGRGGMGVVYKARDKRLERVVALKRLPDPLASDAHAVSLLHREARSAARLNHRNIVTVHDVDREAGGWFLTMELLEGELLSTTLRRRGALPPPVAAALAEQVAQGLGYAHAQGIVHRDVKPSNLFVTRDGTVKLMDFGVAKIVEDARRQRTGIGGTPSYMAPEQARGDAVDGRADLYALGATLFELMTGEVPFAKGDPAYHHHVTEPPDPRQRRAGIPDALAELVLALLRKDPDERPSSAHEVAVRLHGIAEQTLPNARG